MSARFCEYVFQPSLTTLTVCVQADSKHYEMLLLAWKAFRICLAIAIYLDDTSSGVHECLCVLTGEN